jgi:hypothetical protein
MIAPTGRPQIRKIDARIAAPRSGAASPLDPTDNAILAHVDGRSTVRAIAAAMSLPEETVAAAVERLARLGAIDFLPPAGGVRAPLLSPLPPPSLPLPHFAPATEAPPSSVVPRRPSPIQLAALKAPTTDRPPLSGPPSDRGEEVDLRDEQKAQISDMYARCKVGDHYEVLGVPHDAGRKAITRAYFALAATYHPDRYFRKELGPYRHRVETIYRRISEAHESLSVRERRAAYDARLRRGRARMDSIDTLLEEAAAEMRGSSADSLREERAAIPPIEIDGDPANARNV